MKFFALIFAVLFALCGLSSVFGKPEHELESERQAKVCEPNLEAAIVQYCDGARDSADCRFAVECRPHGGPDFIIKGD